MNLLEPRPPLRSSATSTTDFDVSFLHLHCPRNISCLHHLKLCCVAKILLELFPCDPVITVCVECAEGAEVGVEASLLNQVSETVVFHRSILVGVRLQFCSQLILA